MLFTWGAFIGSRYLVVWEEEDDGSTTTQSFPIIAPNGTTIATTTHTSTNNSDQLGSWTVQKTVAINPQYLSKLNAYGYTTGKANFQVYVKHKL